LKIRVFVTTEDEKNLKLSGLIVQVSTCKPKFHLIFTKNDLVIPNLQENYSTSCGDSNAEFAQPLDHKL